MKAKKLLLSSIIATQVLTAPVLAAPDEAIKEFKKVEPIKQEVKHFQGEVKLFIIKDGEKVRVDQKMTDGLRVVNGRTCVGVRDLVNAIEGAQVEWDGTNHIVDITYAGKTISYPVGKPLMWADGKAVTVDVPAQIDPAISKTFLPIRNIAETLGFKVDWDNKAKEVVLTPGAGKTTTAATAQQPRPTTPPAQNKNGKFVLSSGQALPDFNNPPKKADYKLSDADFVDNGDGTETFAKGTPWEMTVMKRLKRVDSSPAHPNFRILGDNGPDDRVGTAIFTQGEEVWEKAWGWINKNTPDSAYLDDAKTIKSLPYFAQFIGVKGGTEKLESLLTSRKIKEEYVNEFKNKVKFVPTGPWDKMRRPFKDGDEFYDATGIIDPGFEFTSLMKGIYFKPMVQGNNNNTYVLMTNGELYNLAYGESTLGKSFVIDKVVTGYGNKWFIIDVPNIKHTIKNPYNSKYGVVALDRGSNMLRLSQDYK